MIRHAATKQNPKLEGGRMIGSAATAQNSKIEDDRMIRSATTTQNPTVEGGRMIRSAATAQNLTYILRGGCRPPAPPRFIKICSNYTTSYTRRAA